MANGKKNNNKKEIELLPEELRRPEEKKKKEEKPEVKMFVPPKFVLPEEEKKKGPKFWDKIFGSREEREKRKKEKEIQKAEAIQKKKEEKERRELFKMKAASKPPETPPSPKPPKPSLPPQPPPPAAPTAKPVPKVIAGVKPLGPEGAIPAKKKFGITLMPAELAVSAEVKRTKQMTILVAVVIILGVIFGGTFGILKWYDRKVAADLEKVKKDLAAVEQQIKNLDEKKNQAQTLQRQFKVADEILAQHVYWTNFFALLEKNTVSDVYFLNLVGGSNGQITLSAVAKSYKAVAEQIVAFKEEENVEKVSITSASASIGPLGEILEVNFDAKLQLKPEIFLK